MSEQKPNIVFIVTDQEAYYRHGWDGGLGPARPNLERLGREGIYFNRSYSCCPLCTPARRSMLTGLYPHNHGFLTLDYKENSEERDHGILYPLLAEQGYRLFSFGKWHTGPGTAYDYGCEGYSIPGYGNPYTTPEYMAYCQERGIEPASFSLEHVFLEAVSPDEPEPGPGYQCHGDEFHPHVTGVLETETESHDAQFVANLACDKLRELVDGEEAAPFFLRVDIWGPHAPYLPAQEYLEMYPPEEIERYGNFDDDLSDKPLVYLKEWNKPLGKDNRLVIPSYLPWSEWQRILSYVYGQITQVDAAGGQILDTLDELGLAENTLVIWTADHGDAVGTFGGHFGKETPLNEEVLRVPLAVRWPVQIAPNPASDYLTSTVDLPVTILDAAGTNFREPVDGESLLNLVEDGKLVEKTEKWRDDVISESHGHHWEPVNGRSVATDRYKYAIYQYHSTPDYLDEVDTTMPMQELYDLEQDPYQLNNLADDPTYADIIADFRRRLDKWQLQTRDPITFD